MAVRGDNIHYAALNKPQLRQRHPFRYDDVDTRLPFLAYINCIKKSAVILRTTKQTWHKVRGQGQDFNDAALIAVQHRRLPIVRFRTIGSQEMRASCIRCLHIETLQSCADLNETSSKGNAAVYCTRDQNLATVCHQDPEDCVSLSSGSWFQLYSSR